jgi:hypothetical protein
MAECRVVVMADSDSLLGHKLLLLSLLEKVPTGGPRFSRDLKVVAGCCKKNSGDMDACVWGLMDEERILIVVLDVGDKSRGRYGSLRRDRLFEKVPLEEAGSEMFLEMEISPRFFLKGSIFNVSKSSTIVILMRLGSVPELM